MIKITELPALAEQKRHIRLTHDGDTQDFRLHAEEMFHWGAKGKRDYNKAIKAIDAIKGSGNGWQIYAWPDISGFDYWMKNMKEQNYIQVTIAFDQDSIEDSEVKGLIDAIVTAIAEAAVISDTYNFDPGYEEYTN